MHYHRLLPFESAAVDSLADVVAGLPDDLAALRLHRRIHLGAGMASGAEGLLLHDYGPGMSHHQAFHGSAGDNPHSAAHSIPNTSADTTANIAARSCATAAATARSSAAASASPGASGTSRPLQP